MTEWQKIETAPKDGTEVLLWNGDWVIGYFETAKEWPSSKENFNKWTTGMEFCNGYDAGFFRIAQPTHWMPKMPGPTK